MKSQYLKQVEKGMDLLATHPKTLFIGQAMEYAGHAVSRQVENYLSEKKLELPVAEDFQAGFSLGLSLEGYIPISIYPRHDFFLLALNQVINHIDKWELMQAGKPHIIFKILVGTKKPLDGGHQHTGNYTQAFKLLCKNIKYFDLSYTDIVYPAYEEVINIPGIYIISEYTELYEI